MRVLLLSLCHERVDTFILHRSTFETCCGSVELGHIVAVSLVIKIHCCLSLISSLLPGKLSLRLLSNILESVYVYKSVAFFLLLLALLLVSCFALVSPVSVRTILSDLTSVLVCVCVQVCGV